MLVIILYGENMVFYRQGVVFGEDFKDVVGGLSGLFFIILF